MKPVRVKTAPPQMDTVPLRGFVTTQLYVQGQSLREIEKRLGFDAGRLSLGAWFAAPVRLPTPDEFDFVGYSQVAGHRTESVYGNINRPATDQERQALLNSKKTVISRWQLSGFNRLVKVIPMIGHSPQMSDNYQYPPGNGIPQWKLTRPIQFSGICYVGNYPDGIFIPESGYTPVKYR